MVSDTFPPWSPLPPPTPELADEPSDSPICPHCEYDLRGITIQNCPECGSPIDLATLSVSRIPWEHIPQRGLFRAFWDTTGYAVFHPIRLSREIQRPVNYPLARRFQLYVILWAWGAMLPWAIAIAVAASDQMPASKPLTITVTVSGLFLSILFATGIASYRFDSRKMSLTHRNRAVALSYYACSPLAWLWLPALLLAPATFIQNVSDTVHQWFVILAIAGATAFLLLILAWLLTTCTLMRAITKSDAGSTFAFAFVLPFLWLLCIALAGVVSIAAYYMAIVIYSLR